MGFLLFSSIVAVSVVSVRTRVIASNSDLHKLGTTVIDHRRGEVESVASSVVMSITRGRHNVFRISKVASTSASTSLTFGVENSYSATGGEELGVGYQHLTLGRIVEPWRDTTLTATTTTDTTTAGDSTSTVLSDCSWEVRQTTGHDTSSTYRHSSKTATLTGVSAVHQFPAPATYTVTATCETSAGSLLTLDENVECDYVRRELRSLSSKDLQLYLDTFIK